MAEGIAIPEVFPFSGTGPGNDYRYDLQPYRPGRPTTAQAWRKLEKAYNYLYGRHRRCGPILVVEQAVYSGGASPLSALLPIYLEDDTIALSLTLVVTSIIGLVTVPPYYRITVTESAGAWSDTIDLPGEATEPVRVHKEVPITVTGWTTIGITGDGAEATHPTLHTVEWKVKKLKRYR